MKRKALPIVFAGLALGALSAPTLAQTQSPFYGSAQLAISDVDGLDNGMSLALTGGMDLTRNPNNGSGLSVEGELTATISEPEVDIGPVSGELSYFTVAGYGVYRYPINQDLALRGRAGLLYLNLDEDVNLPGFSEDDDDFNISAGVGATYRLNPNLNAIAEYTYIDKDINHFSAGVQFRF